MKTGKQDPSGIIKTLIDYSVSFITLVLLTPVILILAIAIKISDNGPVFYSQKRIGFSGKPFILYKFRSMHFGTEEGMPLVSGKKDKRITAIGRFMRKHKFDEIPNLINVLKGEMSIVGPRPEQEYYIGKIAAAVPEYLLLQNVKPGITSWGQVRYGYASSVDQMIERLNYDLCYLNNRSLMFDLKIAVYTLAIIFKGQGV